MKFATMGTRQRNAGMTLMELLVTMVVVGILSAIAIPAYNAQARRAHRTEARTAVLDLAAREERFMATNNTYTASAANLGYAAFDVAVSSGYYKLNTPTNISGGSATTPATFTVSATALSDKGQDKDKDCASFTVDQTGKRSSKNSGGSDSSSICWK